MSRRGKRREVRPCPSVSRAAQCLARLAAAAIAAPRARAATPFRIGLLHTLSPAPLYIAMERGYFRDDGLDAQFRFFEAAQPIAAAAVAGDIDRRHHGADRRVLRLAGRGALKVIGGGLHEEKGFEGTAVLVSKKAYDAGLTTLDKLAGHSFGITQFGSSFHYMLGRIAEAEAFRPRDDHAAAAADHRQHDRRGADRRRWTRPWRSPRRPSRWRPAGEAKIIAWVGDLVPYQITAVFAPERMHRQMPDALHALRPRLREGRERLSRRRSCAADADGQPVHDASTDAAIAAIQKYVFTGDPERRRRRSWTGVGYYDEDGALDVDDVAAQLRWFMAQGMVKGEVNAGRHHRHAVPADAALVTGRGSASRHRAAVEPPLSRPDVLRGHRSGRRARAACWCWSGPSGCGKIDAARHHRRADPARRGAGAVGGRRRARTA